MDLTQTLPNTLVVKLMKEHVTFLCEIMKIANHTLIEWIGFKMEIMCNWWAHYSFSLLAMSPLLNI